MVSVELGGVRLARGGRTLVDDVHLAIGPGELVLVTGPRGCGKSLLLAVAAGVSEPAAGDVQIGGRKLATLQSSARPYVRRNIGYLPAEPPFLRDETAGENVMLALGVRGLVPADAEVLMVRVLAELGSEGLMDRVVADLSPGERRLAAAARALAGPPAIVVLDEPTAGLGEGDRDRLVDAVLSARAAGAAILCASNDTAFCARLIGAGARELRIVESRLAGERAPLRLVGERGGERGDDARSDHESDREIDRSPSGAWASSTSSGREGMKSS